MPFPSLTAPLYIAEDNQEQIANLDEAIFKLNPDTQWFIYAPPPPPKNLKKQLKKTHTKKLSVLFNMLSRLVITFLPRSKRLFIS